ncbi:type VII secretion protein EccCb [Mycobacterium riyadhense]|uniref:type VII secretion protein EccCb n=1 Tax=Mycobacterium riyadhense TaxID=486698 RepID=UPI00195AB4F8|nr:type VII secretion protein EccCb [Mycobacterium riyadhense]
MVAVSSTVRHGLRFAATPDVMPLHEAAALARMLSRYAPTDDAERVLAERAGEARAGQDFLDAFGITDARLWDPTIAWGQVTPAERVRLPIGKKLNGELVYLDLKESAENGMGPHGSMTGWTGSGKSEHCLALVLGLAAKFPPEMVQILLGDFKGESAFSGLEILPHVVGVVSNLEKSLHKLERLELVLRGELIRRQELLNKYGFPGVRQYEQARAAGKHQGEPVGALILVLDEFTQLLQLRPGMAAVMDEVARLGRSLWIHILNASQRAETGKMAGMIAQQGFAIGLKVRSAGESRAAIGSPRAWEEFKSAAPGSAFLVVDDEHTRYRSFFVSGPFVAPKFKGSQRDRTEGHYLGVSKFTAEVVALPDTVVEEGDAEQDDLDDAVPSADAPKLASVLIDRIRAAGYARPRHKLWLPAFEEIGAMPIDEIVEEFWGRPWSEVSHDAGLVVPYGREDDALRHAQNVVSVKLEDTNLGVAGAPQTGKSTAIRTVMMALAMSHSPRRVQFYGIDCGGGKLQSLAGLPHVCGIAAQGDIEKIRRVVSEVERIVTNRQRRWAKWGENGINLMEFRARKFGSAPGEVPEDGHGDVFLIVDNINALRTDTDNDTTLFAIHQRVTKLANESLNFGVHLIISNDQWHTIKCEAQLGAKIELRMAEPTDSKMRNREAAKHVPESQKGRGLVRDGNHLLVAAPYLGEFAEAANEVAATEATTQVVAERWKQLGFEPAPKLQQLPAEIYYKDPRLPAARRGVLKLGMGEREMSTVGINLRDTPHVYCVGTVDSGRTVFLRTVCEAIKEAYTPEQAQVIQFDPDYSLADSLDDRYRKVYVTTQQEISEAAHAIAKKIEADRRPPSGLTPQQLAQWNPVRPKWFILIDDLHLCTPVGAMQSLLQPLVGAIATSRHLDLHVFVTCKVEGWYSTSQQNKIIGAMDGAGASVLVLDGDKREKIIEDVRPAARIPGRGELYSRKDGGQLIQIALPTGWTRATDGDHR